MDTIGTHPFERLSSFGGYFVQSVYTRVQMVCPLLGGLECFTVTLASPTSYSETSDKGQDKLPNKRYTKCTLEYTLFYIITS